MKFAHLADCHIGSWRDPKLRMASIEAFSKAIDRCIEEDVDFIVISGDLFNTSLPSMDALKETVKKLKQLKQNNISCYIVAGSHDFSPSGKTMLDILEEAELFINVAKGEIIDNKLRLKFTEDKKTKAKITGLLGKRGSLEKAYYGSLDHNALEKEPGYKIFMLHSAITELKPKEMENIDSQPLSLLPKGFDYYAAGHVHIVKEFDIEDYGKIVYPGPLFPNSFSELEKLQRGGFYIVEDKKLRFVPVQLYNVDSITIDADNKSPDQVEKEIIEIIKKKEFFNTIVTLRVSGTLGIGKPSDIKFNEIFDMLYSKSAYFVMKNTSKLISKDMQSVKIDSASLDDIEDNLIKEHLGQIKVDNLEKENEFKLAKSLIAAFSQEKAEMKKYDYEAKLIKEAEELTGLS